MLMRRHRSHTVRTLTVLLEVEGQLAEHSVGVGLIGVEEGGEQHCVLSGLHTRGVLKLHTTRRIRTALWLLVNFRTCGLGGITL